MPLTLEQLGWRPYYQQQLTPSEQQQCYPARISTILRSHAELWSAAGSQQIPIPLLPDADQRAVGDWLLLDHHNHQPTRLLERQNLLARKAAGHRIEQQLIASNLDTLFIVSSCNNDFSEARLERYLALAFAAQIHPVIILTKADECDDPAPYLQRAAVLHPDVAVSSCDARLESDLSPLLKWCGTGQTVALTGSSGVGKSTLINSLTGANQITGAARADDAKGRHTTTSRSMHPLPSGGILIDTPGMRELQLSDCDHGVTILFDDITTLGQKCRFNNCQHQNEPGCAIQAALADHTINQQRWLRYQKLMEEQQLHREQFEQQQLQRSRAQGRRPSIHGSKKRTRQRPIE